MRYDVIVVGAGPAGAEAAINLSIRKKSFLLFGPGELSAKIASAPKVNNYLGLPGISGEALAGRFRDHLEEMGVEPRAEQVSTVYSMGDYFAVASNRDTYEATAVIVATGTAPAKLIPGEERLLGRGVGYCATCDAPLYKGKTVVVLGWGEEAVYEANFIAGIAAKTHYLPVKGDAEGLDPAVSVVRGEVRELVGEESARGVLIDHGILEADGIFVLRESIAPASLIPGIETEDGYIRIDAQTRTNLPGCFAAGDCTGKPHQYMRAAGQGQTAALNAAAYVDLIKRERREGI